MANTSEILKDKRVIIGGAVAVLVIGGGVAAVMMNSGGGGGGEAAAPPPAPAPPGGSAAVPPTTPPVAPIGAPKPGIPVAGVAGKPAVTANRVDNKNSFALAPAGYGGVAAGAPPVPAPVGGAAPGGVDPVNANKATLKPIQAGVKAVAFRGDPFISYRIPAYEKPAAYNFLAPLRLADRPKPPIPPPSTDPELQYGPLPYVPRRVAGILYNGSVSAILETGGAGASDLKVVQPGDRVASGIPGIDELTVTAITSTQVTLRADDGRTVAVSLTNLPPGSIQSGPTGGAGGPGGFPGGPGGFPGGPPRPGTPGGAGGGRDQ